MEEVFIVYQEVSLQYKQNNLKGISNNRTITLSVYEKPSVQVIKNVAPHLLLLLSKCPQILRDHEYKRQGTVSILAIFLCSKRINKSQVFLEKLRE